MFQGFRFLFVLAAALAAPRLADACSCLAASPCQQYGRAGAVFAGEVLSVAERPEGGDWLTAKTARLRVARAYKGAVEAGQVVTIEMPGGSSASCSLDVAPGARFVVFAGAGGGRFTTNLCSGSHGLPAGAPWPDLPPPGGSVSGRLWRLEGDVPSRPLPDVAVWIATPGRKIATTTDASGEFRLTGVPAGTWTVEFGLGPAEQANHTIELASPDDCAEVYAWPRPRRQ